MRRIKVWDGPVRLFHWLLVVLIAAAWWTAEEHLLTWHYRIGFTILILIVFRLIWGFVGSSTARFAAFVKGPRAIADYLRGAPHGIGHNPIGALSVLLLLGLTAAVTAFGLFASDEDGIEPGPLAYRISVEASDSATEWHEKGFDVLMVVVALHVAAILYYWIFKRDNLLTPMVTGSREMPEGTEPMRAAPLWRAGLALLVATGFAWWVWSGA